MGLLLTPACVSSYGFPDGTQSLPSIFFTSDRDTGFYLSGSNQTDAICGGSVAARFSSLGINTNLIRPITTAILTFRGGQVDGATAIAARTTSANTLSTAGAVIHGFYPDNATTMVASVSKDGALVPTIPGGATPAASVTYRNHIWVVNGGAGVTDAMYICLKSAADTYSWRSIVTGG